MEIKPLHSDNYPQNLLPTMVVSALRWDVMFCNGLPTAARKRGAMGERDEFYVIDDTRGRGWQVGASIRKFLSDYGAYIEPVSAFGGAYPTVRECTPDYLATILRPWPGFPDPATMPAVEVELSGGTND